MAGHEMSSTTLISDCDHPQSSVSGNVSNQELSGPSPLNFLLTFPCHLCKFFADTKEELIAHISQHNMKCFKCSFSSFSSLELDKHIKCKHRVDTRIEKSQLYAETGMNSNPCSVCVFCDFMSYSEVRVTKHFKDEHPGKMAQSFLKIIPKSVDATVRQADALFHSEFPKGTTSKSPLDSPPCNSLPIKIEVEDDHQIFSDVRAVDFESSSTMKCEPVCRDTTDKGSSEFIVSASKSKRTNQLPALANKKIKLKEPPVKSIPLSTSQENPTSIESRVDPIISKSENVEIDVADELLSSSSHHKIKEERMSCGEDDDDANDRVRWNGHHNFIDDQGDTNDEEYIGDSNDDEFTIKLENERMTDSSGEKGNDDESSSPSGLDNVVIRQIGSYYCWVCFKQFAHCLSIKKHIFQSHPLKAFCAIVREETEDSVGDVQILLFCPKNCEYVSPELEAVSDHIAACKHSYMAGNCMYMEIHKKFVSLEYQELKGKAESGALLTDMMKMRTRLSLRSAKLKRSVPESELDHYIGLQTNDQTSHAKDVDSPVHPTELWANDIVGAKGQDVRVIENDSDESAFFSAQMVSLNDEDMQLYLEMLDVDSDDEVWVQETDDSDSENEDIAAMQAALDLNVTSTDNGSQLDQHLGLQMPNAKIGVVDPGPNTPVPPFQPEREPGIHLPDCKTKADLRKYIRPVDFFFLFFTESFVQLLCEWTNVYAGRVGSQKVSMYEKWTDMNVNEFYKFVGLLMYMSVVKVPRFVFYWSEKSLLNGLWARRFMKIWRFQSVMGFLKTSDVRTEDDADKLTKARFMMDFLRGKCMELFQPYQHISIDERMVTNRSRYSFRKHMRDKPTKWGMKLWVLTDSSTGYTYNFDVYLGKLKEKSGFGVAYDVIMNLVKSLVNQGYHLFFDSFYTSVQLLKDLVLKGIRACGTVLVNKKGFPAKLKNIKEWGKEAKRGDTRWEREGDILALQWKDNQPVSFLSTIHDASTTENIVNQRSQENGEFGRLEVQQPQLVKDYNQNMNGVDLSDQLVGKGNSLRKTNKWWKTLFLHFIDVARVNSYILFTEFRKKNPDLPELHRPTAYNELDFTLELIRQLGDIDEDEDVPVGTTWRGKKKLNHPILPFVTSKRSHCKLCYHRFRKKMKSRHGCSTCGFYFCFQEDRNCLVESHEVPSRD